MIITQQHLIDTITLELGVSGIPVSKTQVYAVLARFAVITLREMKKDSSVPLPGIGRLKVTPSREVSLSVSKRFQNAVND